MKRGLIAGAVTGFMTAVSPPASRSIPNGSELYTIYDVKGRAIATCGGRYGRSATVFTLFTSGVNIPDGLSVPKNVKCRSSKCKRHRFAVIPAGVPGTTKQIPDPTVCGVLYVNVPGG